MFAPLPRLLVAAYSLLSVVFCRLLASITAAVLLSGVSVCRLSASNTAAVPAVWRVSLPPLASNTAAVLAIWRVSLPPFGEQYCRCFCYLACQSAAFRRAILPLILLSGVSVCSLSAINTAAVLSASKTAADAQGVSVFREAKLTLVCLLGEFVSGGAGWDLLRGFRRAGC